MRAPPIMITCDCGATTAVAYGDRWTCESCGKTWDTSQIPTDDYDALVRGVKRYRLLVLGPPLLFAALLIPLAVVAGVKYGFLLFVLVAGYGLLVVPQIRRRSSESIHRSTKSWKLSPE